MADPIFQYSPVEVKHLKLSCNEDGTELIFEGTLDLPGKEVNQYACPKCLEKYHTNVKAGIVYSKKEQ